jgi:hypothetical protein
MKQLLLAVLVLSGGTAVARAVTPVAVSVYPPVTHVRGSIRVGVHVDSNEMNRKLVWEVDGADYYRSSSLQLDGAAAPRNFSFMLHNVPEGEYDVRATVIRNNNSESIAAASLLVGMGNRAN